MTDLNPTEVYRRYRRKELDAAEAIDYLKTIIESGSKADSRVRSMEYLAKLELNKPKDFEFLESLVTSDTNKDIRLIGAKIIINYFLEKGENLLKWIFRNEKSPDCLLGIYNTIASNKSVLAKNLIQLMEETIGKYYLIHHDLLPKEALALELLGKHLCEVYIFAKSKKWYFENLKIKHQEVISIKIENLHSSINSKFFGLLSGLQELILYDCKLSDAFFLGEISRLRINGIEEGPLGSIDEIEGFENLANLKELDLSINSISEITKLEKLTNLIKLNLSHNDIKEIKGLDTLKKLEVLNLECNNIQEIKNLNNLVNLRELNISENKNITDIKELSKLQNLEELLLFNNYLIKEIKGLECLNNLRILDISKDSGMITFKAINANLPWITPFQEGMDVIEYTKNQEILNKKHSDYWKKLFDDRDYIKEMKGLDMLFNLEELYLEGNSISEIKGLERLKKLRCLNLSKNKIKEIKGLENLKNLIKLNLSNNNISPIEGLEGIENDSGVLEPQKFVEYCYKRKKSNYI